MLVFLTRDQLQHVGERLDTLPSCDTEHCFACLLQDISLAEVEEVRPHVPSRIFVKESNQWRAASQVGCFLFCATFYWLYACAWYWLLHAYAGCTFTLAGWAGETYCPEPSCRCCTRATSTSLSDHPLLKTTQVATGRRSGIASMSGVCNLLHCQGVRTPGYRTSSTFPVLMLWRVSIIIINSTNSWHCYRSPYSYRL